MSLPSGTFQETYAQDMAIFRTKTQWVLLAVFLVLLLSFPLYGSDSNLTTLTVIGITVISVLGLNILTGNCGLLSMGHSGFMMVGGYALAILSAKSGWPFWVALPAAGLISGLIGILFGLPSLKIKGFYLIMATVAAYFIIHWLILQFRGVTGGTDGISVTEANLFGLAIKGKAAYFYLVMVIAIAATYLAKNILRTRAGRAFVAIRDNDLAAEVMGVNLWVYKLQAFFVGCVFAGVAGALSAQYVSFCNVEQFPFMNSVWYLGMLIVGGMGSTSGVIFGVIALKLLEQVATKIGPLLVSIVNPQAAVGLSLILPGIAIILFLIFEPRGIAHLWERIKSYYRLWPF
jgi:branched-chain amino acid transport system permease protein